ncbi:MAG: hypothetical protein KC620_15555 [Myxococcales bacterium]|nr:hypothetical protein [Myxococcales bacterium]
MRTRPDNALRFVPRQPKGHVESFFLRANHPTRPLALWLKATLFAPRPDSAVAELWCVWFDGERRRTFAGRETVPFTRARFGTGDPQRIELAGADFDLQPGGRLRGEVTGPGGPCAWDLTLSKPPGPLAEPFSIAPNDKLLDAPFPKSKLLTPFPVLRFDGTVRVFGETLAIDGWHGMQGHNWGESHAWQYAWGQCLFFDGEGSPHCFVEGFSARLRVGGRVTPLISSLVVRRGARSHRFDRLVDLWRQKASIDDLRWRLHITGDDGEAVVEMTADADRMACLGYHNPDGRLSYCLNSKLARVRLRVNPINEPGFECQSEFGGALEFLRNETDDRFAVIA